MRFNLTIIAIALSFSPANGQWAIQMDELFDHIGDSSALELSFGNWEQKTISNASLANWYGHNPFTSNETAFVFNEITQELINFRFHSKKWQFGFATTNYNFNDRRLDSSLFNSLYFNEQRGMGTYGYSSFSTLKHSITLGRSLGSFIDLAFILNGHQLNSLSNLTYSGGINQTPNELSADFSGAYYSFNSNFTDTSRGIATLPQVITDVDSGHYSVYRYAPLNLSFGFYTKLRLGRKISVSVFGNHLGNAPTITAAKEDNSFKLVLNTAVIETIDLLNASASPIITPVGNYTYQEIRSPKRDTTFTRAFQPPVLGADLSFHITESLHLSISTSKTRYPAYNNSRHSLIVKKNFDKNYLLSGIMLENLNSSKSYYNAIFGARFEVAPRLNISCYSNTAINFTYLNQLIVPKSIARMQFNIGAEITLP